MGREEEKEQLIIDKLPEGFEPLGKAWKMNPNRLRAIERGRLVRFNNLYEAAMGAINKVAASAIQSVFDLGDIIYFMPRNRPLKNLEVIELYAARVGSLLARLEAEKEAEVSRDQAQYKRCH